jgi:hypothetical protein
MVVTTDKSVIITLTPEPDMRQALLIGNAVLTDHRIVVVVPDRSVPVPANLRKVASAFVYGAEQVARISGRK